MKDGPHQWPSGAATRKYVDKANDRLTVRLDRQSEKLRVQALELKELRGLLHAVMDGVIFDD